MADEIQRKYIYIQKENGDVAYFNTHRYDLEWVKKWCDENNARIITEQEYYDILHPFVLEDAQAEQIQKLRESCEAEITDKFVSDATGEELYYCMLLRDQSKVVRLSYGDMAGKLYCSKTVPDVDVDGAYKFIDHTKEQIIQVLKDFNVHEQTVTDKFVSLRDQVLSIKREDYETDKDCQSAISAIVW